MGENILRLLSNRSDFIFYLRQDIYKNNQIVEQAEKEKERLEQLIENVKTLEKYPEHASFIPLAKNIYMEGRIVHTGEHYLKIPAASPESYVVLNSANQTVNYLEKNIEFKKIEIEHARNAINQLEERMKILKGNSGFLPEIENNDLPVEIKSEKGVAVKVGEFYEIFEFEESDIQT